MLRRRLHLLTECCAPLHLTFDLPSTALSSAESRRFDSLLHAHQMRSNVDWGDALQVREEAVISATTSNQASHGCSSCCIVAPSPIRYRSVLPGVQGLQSAQFRLSAAVICALHCSLGTSNCREHATPLMLRVLLCPNVHMYAMSCQSV